MDKSILKLTHKHYRVALLKASGHPHAEISADVGIAMSTVAAYLQDVQVKELVEQYRSQFFAAAAESLKQQIAVDAPKTFQKLQDLRDRGTKDDTVQLGACKVLADRQFPATTRHEEDRTIRFVFTKEDREFFQEVIDESKIIDVQPEAMRS